MGNIASGSMISFPFADEAPFALGGHSEIGNVESLEVQLSRAADLTRREHEVRQLAQTSPFRSARSLLSETTSCR